MVHSRFTVENFIRAIKGSGGIKKTICDRMPCHLDTLNKWLARHPTMRAAFDTECETLVALCESALITDIKQAICLQEKYPDTRQNMANIRWVLAKKGQGYSKGVIDDAIDAFKTLAPSLEIWKERRAQVEEDEC